MSSTTRFIVYVASQYGIGETPDFAALVTEAKIANAARVLPWPFPEPVYEKGDKGSPADKLRRTRYGQACQDAKGVMNDAAALVAKGQAMRVWVGTGVVLTGDKDRKVYANVVMPSMLAELCNAASEVHVSAGSEDPREYVAE